MHKINMFLSEHILAFFFNSSNILNILTYGPEVKAFFFNFITEFVPFNLSANINRVFLIFVRGCSHCQVFIGNGCYVSLSELDHLAVSCALHTLTSSLIHIFNMFF